MENLSLRELRTLCLLCEDASTRLEEEALRMGIDPSSDPRLADIRSIYRKSRDKLVEMNKI